MIRTSSFVSAGKTYIGIYPESEVVEHFAGEFTKCSCLASYILKKDF